MDLGVFYEVVVPLMEVKGTATIAISTPLGAWNFYSELTELRDANGKRVFNVKQIDAGKRPVWKPEETLSKVKAIYGNRKTLLEREILGKISDAVNTAFNRCVCVYVVDYRSHLLTCGGIRYDDFRNAVIRLNARSMAWRTRSVFRRAPNRLPVSNEHSTAMAMSTACVTTGTCCAISSRARCGTSRSRSPTM